MAKVSFASKDTYVPALGFQEGPAEVVAANISVYQYPPSRESGEQTPPFLAAVLSFQRLDDKGEHLDEEPIERPFRIEKDLDKMHVGNATSRDDEDPEDLGSELGTVGNCIYTETGAKINKNATFAVLMNSLEERGLKAEIAGSGYVPDLIGLKAHFITTKGEKRSIGGRDIEPTYLVADKIYALPGEKAAKKPVAKAAAASAGSPKANGVAHAAPAAKIAPAAANNEAAEESATAIVAELAADLAGETRDSKKFGAIAYARLVKDKDRDRKLDKAVQELLKNEEWLTEKSADLGFSYADGVFTFGDAAAA